MRQPFNPIKKNLFQLLLGSLQLPLVFLILGGIFLVLGYIDLFVTNPAWEHVLDYTSNIGNIFVAFALLRFFYNITVEMIRSIEKNVYEKHNIVALILGSIRQGLRIIYYLASINIIIILIEPTKFYLNFANSILNTTIIIAIGWIAVQVINTIEAVISQQFAGQQRKSKELNALYTKTRIIKNIATVVIALITLATILMSFSSVRSIGVSILASAGFLTAIVGLAMQKPLASLFSGLQIAISKLVKIGDVVVFDKYTGVVGEISFTYVIIKCSDQRRLMIPINQFIDKPFENWTHDNDGVQSSIYLNLDYRIPISPLREQFKTILEQSSNWDKLIGKCSVSELGELKVKVRLQMSATNVDTLSDLLSEVREKMLTFLQEHYPSAVTSLT